MIGFYVLLINKAERTLALTPGNQFMDTLFVSVFPMVFVHCTAVVTKLDSDINTTSCSSYLPLVCWTGKTSYSSYLPLVCWTGKTSCSSYLPLVCWTGKTSCSSYLPLVCWTG